jgi:hypothetical protein
MECGGDCAAKRCVMSEKAGRFWKIVGFALAAIAFIVAGFAIDGILRLLSNVPVIGVLARFIMHLRDSAY